MNRRLILKKLALNRDSIAPLVSLPHKEPYYRHKRVTINKDAASSNHNVSKY